ncbi:DUF2267 domain-containing protein [Planktothrix sp. FACHB-1355]|uniref:DUF2267 domain-containing protein n=1 Tax=Aerosakkonema funiforme FACHB-1375 TaxID=2949571 RepID=A0A926VMF6_9CYAN|nr:MULTISPECIES: DUF2267 domain-containing protein [Oscillatoriales]MBD2185532.1 DUF2267 domain-containing protein [Aerosakkonema funiforme FACHB-1375]MBD3561041.1 DUF2267 domain-containing protein [Planktothrix sp. FACHB-1355]
MPIGLREDIAYILLKKIDETDSSQGMHSVNFTETDFAGREITPVDFLGHLDYLNQKGYINAEFSGNAYANQEDVPDAVNPKEFDLRIANSYGAADGPLPHLITFKRAELTERGRKMLEKMEANPPQALREGPTVPIATKDMPFLEKVMLKGNLSDPFDARDITEVVFRTMRDMMSTEAADRVANELHEEALPTKDKALQNEVAELWKDTNPIVSFLSRVRPPLIIKSDTFLFRIAQEAGLQPDVQPETVVKAVFSATKDELSQERIQEIANFLPDKIRQLWEQA